MAATPEWAARSSRSKAPTEPGPTASAGPPGGRPNPSAAGAPQAQGIEDLAQIRAREGCREKDPTTARLAVGQSRVERGEGGGLAVASSRMAEHFGGPAGLFPDRAVEQSKDPAKHRREVGIPAAGPGIAGRADVGESGGDRRGGEILAVQGLE